MTDLPSPRNLPAHGYWAGLKNLKTFGRPFWLAMALMTGWGIAQSLILSIFIKSSVDSQSDIQSMLIGIGVSASLVLTGSIFDWLGMRRMLLLLFSCFLLISGGSYVIWIAFGSFGTLTEIVLKTSLSVLSGMFMVFDYMVIKRLCDRSVWGQGVTIDFFIPGFAVSLIVIPLQSLFFSLNETGIPTSLAFPVSLVILLLCLIIIFIFTNADSLSCKKAAEEQIFACPRSLFSGLMDIAKHPFFLKFVLLTIVDCLLGWVFPACYQVLHKVETIRTSISLFYAISSSGAILAALFMFPMIHRINIGKLLMACTISMFLGIFILSTPFSGSIEMILVAISLAVIEGAYALFCIGYMVYVISAMPIRREGSTLAMMAVVWMLLEPVSFGFKRLLDSQHDATWTHAIVDAINPAASTAHPLWLIVLVPVLLGTVLLVVFRRYLFETEEIEKGCPPTPAS
jgi:MFS family permease